MQPPTPHVIESIVQMSRTGQQVVVRALGRNDEGQFLAEVEQ